MTVRRGQDWGENEALPEGGVLVHSDAEARAVVTEARRKGAEPPALGLLGGDLCRTVGGRGDVDRLRSDRARRLPVDCGAVLLDGRLHWFVAHLVARRSTHATSWLFGRVVMAMNAQFLGDWNVAPRSHPNDGRLDVLDGEPPLGDRLKARRRLRHGTHVPHPDIRERRVGMIQVVFERPMAVWLDGTPVGKARQLSIRVEADALTCYV